MIASPLAAQIPQPPAALLPHIKDGALGTDDLSWLHGALPDASPAQRAGWQAIQAWSRACGEARTAEVRAELKAMGVQPVALPTAGYGALPCETVTQFTGTAQSYANRQAFEAAAKDARERLALLMYGAKLGFENAPFDPAWANEEARKLLHATVREQVYRNAFDWTTPGNGPALKEGVWPVLQAYIGVATGAEDAKNTAMLKAHVAKSGWPTVERVGARASDAAWLLVQHADMDPAFQLRALRLMEPLVPKGQVSKANYAYLYDRIMLKLSGKQRYGTQMMCDGARRVAQPLEDAPSVDRLRASVDLGSLAAYGAMMDESFGACRAGG